MPTERQLAALHQYANLMEEVKIRFEAINTLATGNLNFPAPILREFGFVQLRMICELIALGCLLVHGDIKKTQTKDLRKAWHAQKILEILEELHADFYPLPLKQVRSDERVQALDGSYKKILRYEPITTGFLTKEELITLYTRETGETLHRGNLQKFLSPDSGLKRDFSEIVQWAQKASNLLGIHQLSLFDRKTRFHCCLKNRDDNNRVQCTIGQVGVLPPLSPSQ